MEANSRELLAPRGVGCKKGREMRFLGAALDGMHALRARFRKVTELPLRKWRPRPLPLQHRGRAWDACVVSCGHGAFGPCAGMGALLEARAKSVGITRCHVRLK
jgi:hypothetical protein